MGSEGQEPHACFTSCLTCSSALWASLCAQVARACYMRVPLRALATCTWVHVKHDAKHAGGLRFVHAVRASVHVKHDANHAGHRALGLE